MSCRVQKGIKLSSNSKSEVPKGKKIMKNCM
jgi:hypothetical protein